VDLQQTDEPVYVALGSNLGDRDRQLAAAIAALSATDGIEVVAVSPVYETDPVGPPPQDAYLNAAVRLRTALTPGALLRRLLEIEAMQGRSRGSTRDAPRTLDLDLLFYGDRILLEPDLELPHPRLADRPFVLEPLCDLAPDFIHPVLGVSVENLARRVRDSAAVRRHTSASGSAREFGIPLRVNSTVKK
jgi:2-amino-4-hydroxy-6-hydroxymethyldihydropteridine diphosphokinase